MRRIMIKTMMIIIIMMRIMMTMMVMVILIKCSDLHGLCKGDGSAASLARGGAVVWGGLGVIIVSVIINIVIVIMIIMIINISIMMIKSYKGPGREG